MTFMDVGMSIRWEFTTLLTFEQVMTINQLAATQALARAVGAVVGILLVIAWRQR